MPVTGGFPITLAQAPRHGGPLPDAADLVVIGGGVIGISTALHAARRGARVVVLEKGLVAAEQSSRNWGWIRQQGRDPAELPLMMESNAIWRRLERELNADLEWTPDEDFESGIRKTVAWYLDNREWWQRVLDGSYRLGRLGTGE